MLAGIFTRWLTRLADAILNPPRPGVSRGGIGRLLVLVTALLVLGLVPIHLRRGWTATVGTVFFIVLALVIVSTAAGFRAFVTRLHRPGQLKLFGGRITVVLPGFDQELRTFEAWMAVLRGFGLALPALVFFCVWAFIYTFLWAYSPRACSLDLAAPCDGAFRGLGSRPIFGDFLYLSVNLAFANPPPDILANSRVAHMAATIEVITGVALVALYAGSFFGFGRGDAVADGPAEDWTEWADGAR